MTPSIIIILPIVVGIVDCLIIDHNRIFDGSEFFSLKDSSQVELFGYNTEKICLVKKNVKGDEIYFGTQDVRSLERSSPIKIHCSNYPLLFLEIHACFNYKDYT